MDLEAIGWATVVPLAITSGSTLLATALGYLIAGLNEWRRDRRAASQALLDREATAREERAARREEHETAAGRALHEMRLDVIFQLQEALQLTARLTGRTILHDQQMAKEGKVNAQLPDGLSEELFDNAVLISKLRERLLDEGLRREVEYFRDRSTAMTTPMSLYMGLTPDQVARRSMEVLGEWAGDVERVMGHVGEALRAEMKWKP